MREAVFRVSVVAYMLLCAICFAHFTVGEAFFDPSVEWDPEARMWLIASQWLALIGPLLGGALLYWFFARTEND